MIAWLVSSITFILLLFILWRMRSKTFRERAERPKFTFLENLGVRTPETITPHTEVCKENTDEKRNS
jgi:hypothetical protein